VAGELPASNFKMSVRGNGRSVALLAGAASAAAPLFVLPSSQGQTATSQVQAPDVSLRGARAASQSASSSSHVFLGLGASCAAAMASSFRKVGKDTSVIALTAFENELGVQAPVGFWDPAGLSADGNATTFARRRQTELKHGRVAMLATIGYITPEVLGKWPGYLSPTLSLKFADIPNGLAAISQVPATGWAQIAAWGAYCETSQDQSPGTAGAAGDFGWKVITSDDAEVKTKKLAAEIANGRLAMMAIIGMFFQDGLTGSAWGDWANYTDSPLRAFENELGVQEPVGFWDPAGFTADGDVANFKRRRSVELKHGRISMLATMGYITPEVTGKLPGYLSPSAGLKFADIPNGLAAISKVPSLGWAQIAAYFGFVEFAGGFSDYKTGTPGDYGFKVLTSPDAAEKTKKLSAEIANGRLAMMAIIGMFFQDGLTGSAWGDWALYTSSPLRGVQEQRT